MGRVVVAKKSSDFGDRLVRVAEKAECPSLQCILHEIGKSDAECLQLPLQSSCSHSGPLADACKFRVLVEQFEPDQGGYACHQVVRVETATNGDLAWLKSLPHVTVTRPG